MPRFRSDSDVDDLQPDKRRDDLVQLLSLLCGRDIEFPPQDDDASQEPVEDEPVERAREKVLKEIFSDEFHGCPDLTYEQLNEILLLFRQNRISEWFFRFFFLDEDSFPEDPGGESSGGNTVAKSRVLSVEDLKRGVTKFRGYALLCYGNFRYAFNRFNEARSPREFNRLLGDWGRDSAELEESLATRPHPIVSIEGETDIPRKSTWQIGYLSRGKYFVDAAKVHFIDAINSGEVLQDRIEAVEINEIERALTAYWDSWTRLPEEEIGSWVPKLTELNSSLEEMGESMENVLEKGNQNTIKYLTWDFLDVYVATSMREKWHFTDVSDEIKAIWDDEEVGLRSLELRWFDPTQSYETSVIDKGLVEALMLKRATATIYMAQEGDTFGKDSELAATLAQGKPVIAYLPKHESSSELEELSDQLEARSVEYFRKRLRSLHAQGFFEKLDNVDGVIDRLTLIDSELDHDELEERVEEGKNLVEGFRPFFKLISSEEEDFKEENAERIGALAKLMAAIESIDADNRARTLQEKHPLAFQVHLETGVANGVLVARSPRQCATLLKQILLNELEFEIEPLEDDGRRLGTVLVDRTTGSRFRVVTTNRTLTNSFWNFYSAADV